MQPQQNYSRRPINAAQNAAQSQFEDERKTKQVVKKAVVVYIPTYENNPQIHKGAFFTKKFKDEWARIKTEVKDNFIKVFKAFGCQDVTVCKAPNQ